MQNKIILSILLIAAMCLAVLGLAWGLALVTGAVLFSRTLDAVAELLALPGCVKSMVFWIFLIPFSFMIGRVFAPFRRTRIRAVLFLVAVLGVYWTVASVVDHRHFFDPAGRPRKWVDVAPDGHATFFDGPGTNEATGRPRIPVTPALLQKLGAHSGAPTRPQPVDPERIDWFSPVTREAILYYVHGDRYEGGWEFFVGAPEMFHPRTGDCLQPVTAAIREVWETDLKARRDAAQKAQVIAAEELAKKQQAADKQRQDLAAEQQQRQEAERLAAAQRQADAERERMKSAALDAVIAKAQAEEQQRAAALQPAAATERLRVRAEPVSSTPIMVYSMPQTYSPPAVTYYYSPPIRYYGPTVRAVYQYPVYNGHGNQHGRSNH